MRFLMFDRILNLQKHKKILAIKNVSMNEGFFESHFDKKAIMPSALVFESLARVAGWLIGASLELKSPVFLLLMNGAKVYRDIVPGDQMQIECEIVSHRPEGTEAKGKAMVDGQLVASIERLVFGHDFMYDQELLEWVKRRFVYLGNYPLEKCVSVEGEN